MGVSLRITSPNGLSGFVDISKLHSMLPKCHSRFIITYVKIWSMVQSQETFISPLTAVCSDPYLSPKPSLKHFSLPTSHATHSPFLLSVPITKFVLFCTSEGAEVKTAERRDKDGSQLWGDAWSQALSPWRDLLQKQVCADCCPQPPSLLSRQDAKYSKWAD